MNLLWNLRNSPELFCCISSCLKPFATELPSWQLQMGWAHIHFVEHGNKMPAICTLCDNQDLQPCNQARLVISFSSLSVPMVSLHVSDF